MAITEADYYRLSTDPVSYRFMLHEAMYNAWRLFVSKRTPEGLTVRHILECGTVPRFIMLIDIFKAMYVSVNSDFCLYNYSLFGEFTSTPGNVGYLMQQI